MLGANRLKDVIEVLIIDATLPAVDGKFVHTIRAAGPRPRSIGSSRRSRAPSGPTRLALTFTPRSPTTMRRLQAVAVQSQLVDADRRQRDDPTVQVG